MNDWLFYVLMIGFGLFILYALIMAIIERIKGSKY